MDREDVGVQEVTGQPTKKEASCSLPDESDSSRPAAVGAAIRWADQAGAARTLAARACLRPGEAPPDTPVLVPLPKGYFTVVEIRDFDLIARFAWSANASRGRKRYVQTSARRINGEAVALLLHRLVVRPGRYQDVDHINGDTLDNRRANLRAVHHKQNALNRHWSIGQHGVVGVSRCGKAYCAMVGTIRYAGRAGTRLEAALMRDHVVRCLRKWAAMNFPVASERGYAPGWVRPELPGRGEIKTLFGAIALGLRARAPEWTRSPAAWAHKQIGDWIVIVNLGPTVLDVPRPPDAVPLAEPGHASAASVVRLGPLHYALAEGGTLYRFDGGHRRPAWTRNARGRAPVEKLVAACADEQGWIIATGRGCKGERL